MHTSSRRLNTGSRAVGNMVYAKSNLFYKAIIAKSMNLFIQNNFDQKMHPLRIKPVILALLYCFWTINLTDI